MTATSSPLISPPVSFQQKAPHPYLLPVVISAMFMAALDFFIVNVALPSINTDLHTSSASIEWIVAGYGLAYGAGLITGGRLGDLYGTRRMFRLALGLFIIASTACGLALNIDVLIASRVLQGIAAALFTPQVLAIITTSYAGEKRARAFSIYAAALGGAAVFGQLIGGVLIRLNLFGLQWRPCFLINIPIGLVALFMTSRVMPKFEGTRQSKLDITGLLLITGASLTLMLPLIEGRQQGWPMWTSVSFVASAVLSAAFVLQQWMLGRNNGSTIINVALFAERAFRVGLLTQFFFSVGMASFFLLLALFLQQGRRLSPLTSGLMFVPLGIGYTAVSLTIRRWSAKLGRQVIALGGVFITTGLLSLRFVVHHIGLDHSVAWMIPSLVLEGIGLGLALAPLASTILARVRPDHAGAASGVLSTTQQVGGAIGVAVVGGVFFSALKSGAYAHAFEAGLSCLSVFAIVLIVLVQFLPKGISKS